MKNFLKNEKASPWLVLIITFLMMILVIQILGWQYNRFAREEISSLEMRTEKNMAQVVLRDFLNARIAKNESQAKILLTERAMEGVSKEGVELINDLKSFEILKGESVGESDFSFLVKIYHQNGTESIELIRVTKILERYYIDSIQLPG